MRLIVNAALGLLCVLTPAAVAEKTAQVRIPGRQTAPREVLFDGADLSRWIGNWSATRERDDQEANWDVVLGRMDVGGVKYLVTRENYGDCHLHVEWNPWGAFRTDKDLRGQARGNSGVKMMGRYEVQVLDSFENETYPDGQAGALYGHYPPLVNACRPPGQWQSFDILFRAPCFAAGGELLRPARVTVLHNGIAVHHDRVLLGALTKVERGDREVTVRKYAPHPPRGPVALQNHGRGVWYRNIWIQELPPSGDLDEAAVALARMRHAASQAGPKIKDRGRPAPPVVRPGRRGSPPTDALVLINPTLAQEWAEQNGAEWVDGPHGWKIAGRAASERAFGDCQVHLEWRADGSAAPDRPPCVEVGGMRVILGAGEPPETSGDWHCADVLFSLQRWEQQGEPARQKRLTVFCDGRFAREASVSGGRYGDGPLEEPAEWPVILQDDTGAVTFRRIWIRPLGG